MHRVVRQCGVWAEVRSKRAVQPDAIGIIVEPQPFLKFFELADSEKRFCASELVVGIPEVLIRGQVAGCQIWAVELEQISSVTRKLRAFHHHILA